MTGFEARNGDVFATGERGGIYLTREDEERMLALWRTPTGDPITDAIRRDLADQIAAARDEAERQLEKREAA